MVMRPWAKHTLSTFRMGKTDDGNKEGPEMSEIEPTDFDATLKALEGLSRTQIAELASRHLSSEDAESFAVLAASLSLDALRFLSARVLVFSGRPPGLDGRHRASP